MGMRQYIEDPVECTAINGAIRRAFDRRRGRGTAMHRILLVAHDALTRETTARGLRREGYDVVVTSDGREALAVYRQGGFDIVVTDIFMPERDGLETITELREISEGVRIVAISSRPGCTSYLKAAKAFGAAETLAPPFDIRRLCEKVGRAISSESSDPRRS
jgi:DNA-binding NtrC family response regulator